MADVNPRERLYPFLLDRLTDNKNEPGGVGSTSRERGYSPRQLRESLLRDLSNLLNTRAPTAAENLAEFSHLPTSVLNYGVPDLTGASASGISISALERSLLKAIQTFEPRLEKHSLRVSIVPSDDPADHNVLLLEIRGQIIAAQIKEPLYVKTELDLESGQVSLKDRANG